MKEYRRKAAAPYRVSALRVACAFRTFSEDAINVIAGILLLEVLTMERRTLYQQGKSAEAKTETIRASFNRWQRMWDASTKGRWSHRLIPNVEKWVNRRHGELNYYLTQVLTGHGCYRKYLHKFNCEDAPDCPTGAGVEDDAEHTFFGCPRFSASRDIVEDQLNTRLTPENLVEQMLSSETAWKAISTYAAAVMKELR